MSEITICDVCKEEIGYSPTMHIYQLLTVQSFFLKTIDICDKCYHDFLEFKKVRNYHDFLEFKKVRKKD